ncbi:MULTISPECIES: hypothetical protein [Bartonella]|uniref:hypothetical protein n=1 Tax=Bartonella TaxID=773 RepID=UPI0023611CB1|nr:MULTISPECIES: hypothetical protein [Bartonella]
MNGISANKDNIQEKNPDAKKSIPSIIIRKVFNIIRIILAGIFRLFIFTIFLIMFQMRGLVHIALSFIAGASGLACFFFFFGYLLQRHEATADEAGISLTLLLAIGEGVFSVCSLYAMWGTTLSYYVWHLKGMNLLSLNK